MGHNKKIQDNNTYGPTATSGNISLYDLPERDKTGLQFTLSGHLCVIPGHKRRNSLLFRRKVGIQCNDRWG